MGGQISARAKALKVDKSTIYSRLHRFLAFGSIKNALIPDYPNCGAPGKEKAQNNRLGRKPKVHDKNNPPPEGYKPTALDKERLGKGFALVGPTRTPRDAYGLVSAAFWGDTIVDKNGNSKPELWPKHLRPSYDQFRYWGARYSTKAVRERWLGFGRGHRPDTHHGGSTQNLVTAVGQVAMLDSTSIDSYLTSIFSRKRVLPPMHRTIIKEVRSTAYLGVYVGWEHPSPRTALLAVLCAAEDKYELCRRFGIDAIGPGDWPGMVSRTYLADNGEMRAEEATEAEQQIGFQIELAKTYSGESKGDVESQHRIDHKRVDHKLPGTTRGKQRERGMQHAAELALWNYWEYYHELLLHIIEYNNTEVLHLAPTEMLRQGIKPTRINLFKWLRDQGQTAEVRCDLNLLRALTLPSWPAAMQHNGIILKNEGGGRNVPIVRFMSEELKQDKRYQKARSLRKVVPIDVRLEPGALDAVWVPTANGLLRVPNVQADETLKREGTLADLLDLMAEQDAQRQRDQQSKDQADAEGAFRREQTTDRARKEKAREVQKTGKTPSKSEMRKNLRQNRREEMTYLQSGEASCAAQEVVREERGPTASVSDPSSQNAMAEFLKNRKHME